MSHWMAISFHLSEGLEMSRGDTQGFSNPSSKTTSLAHPGERIPDCDYKVKVTVILWALSITTILSGRAVGAAERLVPAQVIKHTRGDSQSVQALLFQSQEGSPGVVSHDHLVFVDTSASQVGTYRQHALAVLEAMLKGLPETERVRLFAVDVDAQSYMDSFASVQSCEVQSAVSALKTRIPLGATNIQRLVETALDSATNTTTCSIIYIGDGMSTADLLEPAEFRSMVSSLRRRQMPFHSYGVGPEINLQVLGILAHQSGGSIDFDDRSVAVQDEVSPSQIAVEHGAMLAKAVQRPVIYPATIQFFSQQNVTIPLLPLRTDRETIHIFRGNLASDTKVVFTLDNSETSLEFCLSSPVEYPNSAFLVALAEQVERDGGISNSLAGRNLMNVYQSCFQEAMGKILQSGVLQLELGNAERAAQSARQIVAFDPSNQQASSLLVASERLHDPQNARTDPVQNSIDLESHSQPGLKASLIREQDQLTRVKTEKLRNQVNNAIQNALRGEPESGLALLKQVDNSVRASIDVNPEVRLQLQKRLESEMTRLRNAADRRAQEKVQLAEQLAQLESQKLLMEQASLDESQLEGLIERVRGLMLEGRHGHDEAYSEAQNVADVAINLRPGEKTSTAARFDAEAAHQLTRSYRLRARRADQLLETLHQVELAHIPFPDEPPVRFPTAEVWSALTARRQKWKNVDLRSENPRELRIQSELNSISEASFTDIPLKDAIDVLKDQHRIEIQFDEKTLADEGVSKEKEVTLVLSGVTLRSILRLLLEPIGLTYIIEDEVMKITTSTAAETKMS